MSSIRHPDAGHFDSIFYIGRSGRTRTRSYIKGEIPLLPEQHSRRDYLEAKVSLDRVIRGQRPKLRWRPCWSDHDWHPVDGWAGRWKCEKSGCGALGLQASSATGYGSTEIYPYKCRDCQGPVPDRKLPCPECRIRRAVADDSSR